MVLYPRQMMNAMNRMKMVNMGQPELKQASIEKADNKSLFFAFHYYTPQAYIR